MLGGGHRGGVVRDRLGDRATAGAVGDGQGGSLNIVSFEWRKGVLMPRDLQS